MHREAPPRRRSARPRRAAGLRLLSPLVGTPLTTSRQVRRRRQVAADRPPQRRAVLDALRPRRQAAGLRRPRRHAAPARRRRCWSSTTAASACERRRRPVGLPAAEPSERLRERSGRASHAAVIGPAGESLVRYATISHDNRHAGRGGLGAVMGAKRLKALAVRRRTARRRRRPGRRCVAAARDLSQRSFGPATAKYRELGTRRQPADVQPPRRAADAQLPAGDVRGGRRAVRRGARRARARRAAVVRRLHHRLRAHLRRQGRRAACAWSTRTSSRSARCAASATATPCCASARCDELGLDTSRPAARSPSRWSAPSAGCSTRRAALRRRGRAAARARRDRARATGSATCWPRARAGRRASSAAARRTSRRTSRAWSCPATSRARCRRWRSASPSARAAPTTTARAPTRPTSPDASTA